MFKVTVNHFIYHSQQLLRLSLTSPHSSYIYLTSFSSHSNFVLIKIFFTFMNQFYHYICICIFSGSTQNNISYCFHNHNFSTIGNETPNNFFSKYLNTIVNKLQNQSLSLFFDLICYTNM